MAGRFEDYLRKLRETPLEEHTEHTGRSALEALLNRFAAEAGSGVAIQHEPKREGDKGAPDFKIKSRGMILGYVEVKEIGANLDRVLKSDQIKRYRTLSDNILLTDYLQWMWIDREGVKGREYLAFPTDLEDRRLRLAPERAEAVAKLISAFFSEPPQGIGQSEQLALALAARSRLLRDYLGEELVRQEREHKEGRLYGLFQIFRDQVFHELTLHEFADAFAQMLAYGLFLARLNSESEPVTLHNARQHVPGSFRLIRELVDFLSVLDQPQYRAIGWALAPGPTLAQNRIDTAIRRVQGKAMRRSNDPDLFGNDEQPDMFGNDGPPAYRPDPDKVRARLHKILAEARAAETLPWEPGKLSLYRTIVPQLTLWLPEEEGAQLRFEFETELERLAQAA